MQEEGTFNRELLESIFHTSKKTIQEYVREIERHTRYRSVRSNMLLGTILDDRARLIDLYDACLQQDAHIRAVIETLESQILGDRYMLARLNDKGKYVMSSPAAGGDDGPAARRTYLCLRTQNQFLYGSRIYQAHRRTRLYRRRG